MTQLRVTQQHVDGMSKRFGDLLADINSILTEVQGVLSPANEPNVEAQQSVKPFLFAAERLSNAVALLAGLTVTKRWQTAMQAAVDAPDPDLQTMDAVAHSLHMTLVMQAANMSETATRHGPFAAAFRAAGVEGTANAIAMCEVLQSSHEATEKMCADNGIDYALVQAGDKAAISALVDVVERTNGGPIQGLRERLGIAEPAAPPVDASDHVHADIAEALGLAGGAQGAAGLDDGTTSAIRA